MSQKKSYDYNKDLQFWAKVKKLEILGYNRGQAILTLKLKRVQGDLQKAIHDFEYNENSEQKSGVLSDRNYLDRREKMFREIFATFHSDEQSHPLRFHPQYAQAQSPNGNMLRALTKEVKKNGFKNVLCPIISCRKNKNSAPHNKEKKKKPQQCTHPTDQYLIMTLYPNSKEGRQFKDILKVDDEKGFGKGYIGKKIIQYQKEIKSISLEEMFALILYTDSSCQRDLKIEQVVNNYRKWAIWDGLLWYSIYHLGQAQKKQKKFKKIKLFSGLAGVDIPKDKKSGKPKDSWEGCLGATISTTCDEDIALKYTGDKGGLLLEFDEHWSQDYHVAAVQGISCFKEDEYLISRGINSPTKIQMSQGRFFARVDGKHKKKKNVTVIIMKLLPNKY
eukprot:22122_1